MPGTQAPSTGNNLGPNAFLQLLTTEMQNQDPTSPQDPTQSVTQLAQFSALQYQQQMTQAFQSFQSNFGVLQAASLVGQQVTVENAGQNGTSSTQTGTVTSIDVQNGVPYFTMSVNGQQVTNGSGQPLLFSLQQIVGIGNASGSGSGSGGGSGGGTGGGTGSGGG